MPVRTTTRQSIYGRCNRFGTILYFIKYCLSSFSNAEAWAASISEIHWFRTGNKSFGSWAGKWWQNVTCGLRILHLLHCPAHEYSCSGHSFYRTVDDMVQIPFQPGQVMYCTYRFFSKIGNIAMHFLCASFAKKLCRPLHCPVLQYHQELLANMILKKNKTSSLHDIGSRRKKYEMIM